MKTLLLSLLSFFHCPLHGENKLLVEKIATDPTDSTGVVYSLPKTVVGIDVTLKKAKFKKGKFAADTDKFFDLKPDVDYDLNDSTTFTVDSVAIKTRQIADTSELYRVKLTKEWMKDHHFNLELAEDGTLSKGEITVTNKRVDFFLSILGTVASIAGKFVGAAALTMNNNENKSLEALQDECDKVVGQFAFKPKEAAETSPEAKHAFCEIVKLLQRRQNILLGANAVVNGTTTLLKELDLEIKKHFADGFTGASKESSWTARFEHIPTKEETLPLFSLDANCGLRKPASNWLDSRVGDGFESTEKCTDKGITHTFEVKYAVSPNGSLHTKFKNGKPPEHSFAFRIPASYMATVTDTYTPTAAQSTPKTDEVAKVAVTLAQCGVIGYMPAIFGGKKSSVTVTLHSSGALKSVDINVEAQGNIAETAGTAASSLADGILARRKAAQDAADDVTVAERKQKILEAEVAAKRAQCILDGLCPLNPE